MHRFEQEQTAGSAVEQLDRVGQSGLLQRANDRDADAFVFGLRSGVDTVSDFGNGRDILDLSAWYAAGYKASLYMVGEDTYVTDGRGDTVILTGVASSELQATSTGFVFA